MTIMSKEDSDTYGNLTRNRILFGKLRLFQHSWASSLNFEIISVIIFTLAGVLVPSGRGNEWIEAFILLAHNIRYRHLN